LPVSNGRSKPDIWGENWEETGYLVQNKPVMKVQNILGLILIGAAGLFAWGYLGGMTFETRPVRAESETRELARVVLDYRHDTGTWPRNPEGEAGLKPLLGSGSGSTPTMLAGPAGGGMQGMSFSETHVGTQDPKKAWLREIPLDPWGSSYRVMITENAVAVLSIGPNRILDTDPARLWTRPENINPCDGDDVGYVLEFDQDGESP